MSHGVPLAEFLEEKSIYETQAFLIRGYKQCFCGSNFILLNDNIVFEYNIIFELVLNNLIAVILYFFIIDDDQLLLHGLAPFVPLMLYLH